MPRPSRGRLAATASVMAMALLLAACSGAADPTASSTSVGSTSPGCTAYSVYGSHPGTHVSFMAASTPAEQDAYERTWAAFERCTGITVTYDDVPGVASDLATGVATGDLPDLAVLPQPGPPLLQQLVASGAVKAAPDGVSTNVDTWFNPAWRTYGSVDGTLYAAPLDATMDSLVWYSPSVFRAHGWTVPTTWDAMLTLSDTMAAEGLKPWCGGIASATSSGWPATDWLEEVVLRQSGGDTYDKWVSHDVRFDSPEITNAMDAVAYWMRNARYVNAGIGGVASIATTGYQDAGRPVLDGTCGMFQQGASYATHWSTFRKDVRVGPDGDVFAFYLPPMDPGLRAVEGSGELVVAFSARPEVRSVQTYLSSPTFAAQRAALGGWVSPSRGVAASVYRDPVARLSATHLADAGAVFRLDASELMPPAVGADAECRELTAWFAQNTPTKDVLDAIDAAWPVG